MSFRNSSSALEVSCIQAIVFAVALPLFVLQGVPAGRTLPAGADTSAFLRSANERNPQTKKKLAVDFEKKFPKSKHLPDVYVQLSRVLVSQTDFDGAKQYAQKAVSAIHRIENAPPEGADNTWHEWMKTVESSAVSNVTWVNQMIAWQQQQVRSNVLGRRN